MTRRAGPAGPRPTPAGLSWGSGPRQADRQINHLGGGRGVYIRDPDGIAYELFTAVP